MSVIKSVKRVIIGMGEASVPQAELSVGQSSANWTGNNDLLEELKSVGENTYTLLLGL